MSIEPTEGGFRVVGQVDLSNIDRFREAVGEASPGSELVLDLRECTFLGSEGVGVLIKAAQNLADGRLVLRSPNDILSKVLDISGLGRLPNVHIEAG